MCTILLRIIFLRAILLCSILLCIIFLCTIFVALRAVSLGLTDFKVVIYLLQAGLDKINNHFKIFNSFRIEPL